MSSLFDSIIPPPPPPDRIDVSGLTHVKDVELQWNPRDQSYSVSVTVDLDGRTAAYHFGTPKQAAVAIACQVECAVALMLQKMRTPKPTKVPDSLRDMVEK